MNEGIGRLSDEEVAFIKELVSLMRRLGDSYHLDVMKRYGRTPHVAVYERRIVIQPRDLRYSGNGQTRHN